MSYIGQLKRVIENSYEFEKTISNDVDNSQQRRLLEQIINQVESTVNKVFIAGSESSKLFRIANTVLHFELFSQWDYIAPIVYLKYGNELKIITWDGQRKLEFQCYEEFDTMFEGDMHSIVYMEIHLNNELLKEAELIFSSLNEKDVENRLSQYASGCDYYVLVVGAQASIQNTERKYIEWIQKSQGSTRKLMGLINDVDSVDTTSFIRQNLEGFFHEEYYKIVECVSTPEALEESFTTSVMNLLRDHDNEKYESTAIKLKHNLLETQQNIQRSLNELTQQSSDIMREIYNFDKSWEIFEANSNINRYRVSFIISDSMRDKLCNDIDELIGCIQMNLENEINAIEDKDNLMYFIEDYLQYIMAEFADEETLILKADIYDQFHVLSEEIKKSYRLSFGKEVSGELNQLLDFDPNKLLSTDMVYSGEFMNIAKFIMGTAVNAIKGYLNKKSYFILEDVIEMVSEVAKSLLNGFVDKHSSKANVVKTVKKSMIKILDEQGKSIKYVYTENIIPMLNTEMMNAFNLYIEQINQLIHSEKEVLQNKQRKIEKQINVLNEHLYNLRQLLTMLQDASGGASYV